MGGTKTNIGKKLEMQTDQIICRQLEMNQSTEFVGNRENRD